MSALLFRVSIEPEGILLHTWTEAAAAKLHMHLAVDHETAGKTNLFKFKFMAWMKHPAAIPFMVQLAIAEGEALCRLIAKRTTLPPYLREKSTLCYRVIIHLKSVAYFTPRPPPFDVTPPSDDGDSGHAPIATLWP